MALAEGFLMRLLPLLPEPEPEPEAEAELEAEAGAGGCCLALALALRERASTAERGSEGLRHSSATSVLRLSRKALKAQAALS